MCTIIWHCSHVIIKTSHLDVNVTVRPAQINVVEHEIRNRVLALSIVFEEELSSRHPAIGREIFQVICLFDDALGFLLDLVAQLWRTASGKTRLPYPVLNITVKLQRPHKPLKAKKRKSIS